MFSTHNAQNSPSRFSFNGSNSLSLYTSTQIYDIEKNWFENNNPSYALMQQAAWQIAYWIDMNIGHGVSCTNILKPIPTISVWVGSGNNGGDGWLVAHYLKQLGYEVSVIEVAKSSTTDASKARETATSQGINVIDFEDIKNQQHPFQTDIIVDGLFGIGIDRAPEGDYKQAINLINQLKQQYQGAALQVYSIDIPSGLVASTGQVFAGSAVRADVTLCLVARKIGLHIKDAADYTGSIVDIPLIPSVLSNSPKAQLALTAQSMPRRENNTHKGSFGHVLVVGGNQVEGSQGMGGASLLAASSALACGVGKVTVACHKAFHSSLITSVPNAMSIDINDLEGVKPLINDCDVMAIGMGFGRDEKCFQLFKEYIQIALEAKRDLVIDADGLYHLASMAKEHLDTVNKLINHANENVVWYTPHSGEAARLLNCEVKQIESDRVGAIENLFKQFNGSWLLKGAGSLVYEDEQLYVSGIGNPGMATAGMGDVLSGLAAGLLAQTALDKQYRSLIQSVLIHAMAGDELERHHGVWALQASDMPKTIGEVLHSLTEN